MFYGCCWRRGGRPWCWAAGEQLPVARAELRDWLKPGLVVEREGRLIATDALQKVFHFLNSLEEEHMAGKRFLPSWTRRVALLSTTHLSGCPPGRGSPANILRHRLVSQHRA